MRDEYAIRRLLRLLALVIFLGAVVVVAQSTVAEASTGGEVAGPSGVGPVLAAAAVWFAGSVAVCRWCRPGVTRRDGTPNLKE